MNLVLASMKIKYSSKGFHHFQCHASCKVHSKCPLLIYNQNRSIKYFQLENYDSAYRNDTLPRLEFSLPLQKCDNC